MRCRIRGCLFEALPRTEGLGVGAYCGYHARRAQAHRDRILARVKALTPDEKARFYGYE